MMLFVSFFFLLFLSSFTKGYFGSFAIKGKKFSLGINSEGIMFNFTFGGK